MFPGSKYSADRLPELGVGTGSVSLSHPTAARRVNVSACRRVGARGALPRLRGRGKQGDRLRQVLPFAVLCSIASDRLEVEP